MRPNSMRYVVQRQPLHNPRYAETVVAVEMRDAEPRDRAGGDPGVQHLPLGPLPRIEQEAVLVPAQEVAVLRAFTRRHLAAGTEDDQLPQPRTSASFFDEMLAPHDTTAMRPDGIVRAAAKAIAAEPSMR